MGDNVLEAVARVARAVHRRRRAMPPRTRLAPWALERLAARSRVVAAELARLAAAARLAGRHDE